MAQKRSDKPAKNEISTTSFKFSNGSRKWTLIFVGDRGKIVPFRRFKGLVFLSAFVLVVLAAAAIALLLLYRSTVDANRRLERQLAGAREKYLALRDEKDVLMARLVIAGVRTEKTNAPKKAAVTPIKRVRSSEKDPSIEPGLKSGNAAKRVLSAPPQPSKKARRVQAQKPIKVVVENFAFTRGRAGHSLQAQFKVKNKGPKSSRLEGYALVVLKPHKSDPDNWVAVPSVPLVSGKPSEFRNGHYFSISNFKTLKLKEKNQSGVKGFKYATVFVFDTEGALLMQKTFPVTSDAPPAPVSSSRDANARVARSRVRPQTPPLGSADISEAGQKESPTSAKSGETPSNGSDKNPHAQPPVFKRGVGNRESLWAASLPYTIHVDSFQELNQAEKRIQELIHMNYDCFTIPARIPGKGAFNRVFVGKFKDADSAEARLKEIRDRKEFGQDIHVVSRQWAFGE